MHRDTHGSSEAQRPPLLAGRFVLARRVGKGGTANVYLAFDLQLNRWRAAKIMHQRFAADDEMRERFDREARMMARIDDRNVVRVLDVQMGDLPYMLMEYMEAGCVLDWMRSHAQMPPQLAIKITKDLTKGLIATHRLGVVHRDVKPHNLLVNRHGDCKLTDYGIAKMLSDAPAAPDDEKALTRVGASMGTASFMPPEQRHDASSVDERADVYAVGATLFTFVQRKAGKDLFVADVADEQFEGMPDPLREVVVKACRYRPEDRHESMEALLEDLTAAEDAVGPPAEPYDFPGPVEDLPDEAPAFIDYERVRELRELVTEGAVRSAYVPEVYAKAIDGWHEPVELDFDAYTLTPMAGVRHDEPGVREPPARLDDAAVEAERGGGGAPHGDAAEGEPIDEEDVDDLPTDVGPIVDAAAAAAREDEADGGEADRSDEGAAAEPATTGADESAEGRTSNAAAASALGVLAAVVAMLLVLGVVVLLGTGYGLASTASQEIRAADAALVQSEHELEDVLNTEARIVELLVGRGADRERLERAYFAYRDGEKGLPSALEYVDVLDKQHAAVTSRYGADAQIERSWRVIEAKAREAEARRAAAQEAREGLGAVLARSMGL